MFKSVNIFIMLFLFSLVVNVVGDEVDKSEQVGGNNFIYYARYFVNFNSSYY